ncbi:hypothetical protein ACFQY5_05340 [Paeniroseomonas aquatica]|uniref:hypothetical protein n=1 Tax=Paeniroseomonas aquatica TaxID=373043 RepID=UPI00361A7171
MKPQAAEKSAKRKRRSIASRPAAMLQSGSAAASAARPAASSVSTIEPSLRRRAVPQAP